MSRSPVFAEPATSKEEQVWVELDRGWPEALYGNPTEARRRAAAMLALSTGRGPRCNAAALLALAGDAERAQTLANDLAKRFPEDTVLQSFCLPTVYAGIALDRHDPPKAIEALQATSPYELSFSGLISAYVRGETYLIAHRGAEAAAEFQKILDHRGIILNDPIGALAHLQIGRAYAMQGETAKAKAAYQDFLTLWKDADPDIPLLIAAKTEFAKLH